MVSQILHIIQYLGGLGSTVYIDNFFKDRFELLFADQLIHFQFQQVFRFAPVYKAQILRNDLIEQETSQCGFHDTGNLLPFRVFLCHSHLDAGMQRTFAVLIGKDRFIDISVGISLTNGARPLLCQIIDAQYHILRRHRHKSAVGGL